MTAPWRRVPSARALADVPLYVWVTLVAGVSSMLVTALFVAGVPVLSFAVVAAMAQFALYVIVAFGDGQLDLFPRARWWERGLFAAGGVTQAVRGIVAAINPVFYVSTLMTVVGALGCVAVLVAFVSTARLRGWSWYTRWLALGVSVGLIAFVTALAGVDPTLSVGLLVATSLFEVAAVAAALRGLSPLDR